MTRHQRLLLEILSHQTSPKYPSWLAKSRRCWMGLYGADDFVEDFLEPLCELGFVKTTTNKNKPLYSITLAGLEALETKEEPLQVTPGRMISVLDGTYQPGRWDVASMRGCHRSIGSVGVAC